MKLFLALAAGIAGGYILGILFAPQKGVDTRRDIIKKGGEITDDLRLRMYQLGDFINEKLDSTKGVYQQFIRLRRMV